MERVFEASGNVSLMIMTLFSTCVCSHSNYSVKNVERLYVTYFYNEDVKFEKIKLISTSPHGQVKLIIAVRCKHVCLTLFVTRVILCCCDKIRSSFFYVCSV